jgi:hypothetical protein
MDVVRALFTAPRIIRPHPLAPSAMVSLVLASMLGSLLWPSLALHWAGLIALYPVAILFLGLITWCRQPGLYALLLPVVILTIHLSYGLGSLWQVSRVGLSHFWSLVSRMEAH